MKKPANRLLPLRLALTLLPCCAAQAEPAEIPGGTPQTHTVEDVTYPYLRQLSDGEKVISSAYGCSVHDQKHRCRRRA